MTEDELFIHAYGSDIFKKWHWFRFHFENICGAGVTHSPDQLCRRV